MNFEYGFLLSFKRLETYLRDFLTPFRGLGVHTKVEFKGSTERALWEESPWIGRVEDSPEGGRDDASQQHVQHRQCQVSADIQAKSGALEHYME